MSLLTPVILLPTQASSFRASSLGLIVSGTTEIRTSRVEYTYAVKTTSDPSFPAHPSTKTSTGISLSVPVLGVEEVLPWSFDMGVIPLTYSDEVELRFYAREESTGETSLPVQLTVTFALPQLIFTTSPIPTGVSIDRKNYALTVSNSSVVLSSSQQSFIGFNYYVSLDSGRNFVRMNRDYVQAPTSIERAYGSVSKSTAQSGSVQVDTTVSEFVEVPTYSFALNRKVLDSLVASGKLPNIPYNETTTFFFVVTSVVYDNTSLEMGESLYSSEISGRFLVFSTNFQELPPRTRDDIVLSMASRMLDLNSKLNVLSGGVIRDQVDPVAEEFADYYVVQDFISRCQSLDGLVAFDDADGDGVSDPVATSTDKRRLQIALRLPNDGMVQSIIDAYFDKYAKNVSLTRLPATFAVGSILFYATSIPPDGLYVSDGAIVSSRGDSSRGKPPIQFRVQGSKRINFADKEHYYNKLKNRYEITADVECMVTGESGNVVAGDIIQLVSGGDLRFKVINTASTYSGRTTEPNLSLANRSRLALAGLDSGTEPGYALQALSVGGVSSVRVEKSGDPLMRRDIDQSTGKHLGGKVDIYVQGSMPVQVQDTFAFAFGGPEGLGQAERFFVEDANTFRIRTNASAVTASTPIFSITRALNATRGREYDLAGALVGVGDGDTIILSANTVNLSIGMATLDVIEVDYRYRGSESMVLSQQPVESIVSVVGDIDGDLTTDNYRFIKLEDPLLNGNSTEASDGVALQYFNNLPTMNLQTVTDEPAVLVADRNVLLSKKGVDSATIVVSSTAGTSNPYVLDLDYRVIRGGSTGTTEIALVPSSKIRSGGTVYISYECGQNFTITYTVNNLLQLVKGKVETMRHAVADVSIKQAIRNEVDIAARVIRNRGASASDVSNRVATALSARIQNLPLGTGINLDDIVNIIKNTNGVKTVSLPLTRAMKRNGSFVPNDHIGSTNFVIFSQSTSRGVTAYMTQNPVLSYGTLDKGGDTDKFRAIYENGISLVLADTALTVAQARGRGYIRADGRLIVSTTDGTPPQLKDYSAAYYTFVPPEQEFAGDITVDEMENLTVGTTSITIDASSEEQVTKRGL